MKNQELENLIRTELRDIMPNVIWRNDHGEYEVFGHYRIVKENTCYRVFCSASDMGLFSTTKSALSWCIADKYRNFNLARQISMTDQRLSALNNDLFVRAGMANRSRKLQFKEDVDTKLESKIIRKKELENQLAKYVESAKYLQQRGFDNETARSGRATKN